MWAHYYKKKGCVDNDKGLERSYSSSSSFNQARYFESHCNTGTVFHIVQYGQGP